MDKIKVSDRIHINPNYINSCINRNLLSVKTSGSSHVGSEKNIKHGNVVPIHQNRNFITYSSAITQTITNRSAITSTASCDDRLKVQYSSKQNFSSRVSNGYHYLQNNGSHSFGRVSSVKESPKPVGSFSKPLVVSNIHINPSKSSNLKWVNAQSFQPGNHLAISSMPSMVPAHAQQMKNLIHQTILSNNSAKSSIKTDLPKDSQSKVTRVQYTNLKTNLKDAQEMLNKVERMHAISKAQLVNTKKNGLEVKKAVLLNNSNLNISSMPSKPLYKTNTKLIRKQNTTVDPKISANQHRVFVNAKNVVTQNIKTIPESKYRIQNKQKILNIPKNPFESSLVKLNNVVELRSGSPKAIKSTLCTPIGSNYSKQVSVISLLQKKESLVTRRDQRSRVRNQLKTDHFINIDGAMFKRTATSLQRQRASSTRKKASPKTKTGNFNNKRVALPHLLSKVNRANNYRTASKYKVINCTKINKKYTDVKRIRKIHNQQKIIATAKLKSLQVLRSKQTNSRYKSKYVSKDVTSTNNDHSGKKLDNTTSKKVSYCTFYHRYGHCQHGDKCLYIHNKERVAICTRFLRGRCRDAKCLFAHTHDKGRMPVCSHFLKDALCTRDDCPYLHVKLNENAPVCEDFLHGHCDKREKCELKHILECSEFRETGRCPRINCPLPHKKTKVKKVPKRVTLSTPKQSLKRNISVLGETESVRKRQKKNVDQKKKSSKAADKPRYFDTVQPEESVPNSKNVSDHRRKVLESISEKRFRLLKMINNRKELEKKPATLISKKSSGLLGTAKGIAEEEDVIFVQPLDVFQTTGNTLPDFIPL